MPLLGAGTYRLKEQAAIDSVTTALELGYRHIDTAQIYGNEKEVGDAIKASGIPREEIFLTTKVWMDKLSYQHFAASVRESLEKLQTDYVDLLLIHWPLEDESEVSMAEYLGELKAVQDNGLTRHIGVSNFTNAQLQQAIEILGRDQIYTNQVEVHPYLQNRKVVSFCKQNNVLVTGYMPFAYGEVLKDETLHKIADKHFASPAQVILAWLRHQGIATIPSSTNPSNMQLNMAAEKISLDAEDMVQIAELEKGQRMANPSFAPDWD